mmetsp:Transcript_24007/g.56009  ORF Transcript_24007/g.56009 Transcript_24007/m.56009 type:complete len:232 (-) Transcript_24007:954-1649(-)
MGVLYNIPLHRLESIVVLSSFHLLFFFLHELFHCLAPFLVDGIRRSIVPRLVRDTHRIPCYHICGELLRRRSLRLGQYEERIKETQGQHPRKRTKGPRSEVLVHIGEHQPHNKVTCPIHLTAERHGRSNILGIEHLGHNQPRDGSQSYLEEDHVLIHGNERNKLGFSKHAKQGQDDKYAAQKHTARRPEDESFASTFVHQQQGNIGRHNIHSPKDRSSHKGIINYALEEDG